jgi:hypothetical protein
MRALVLLFVALPALAEETPADARTHNDFSGKEGQTPFVFRQRGKPGADPVLKEGRLQLLFGRAEQKCSIAFERTAEGARRRIEARFKMALQGQNEGYCLALLHTGRFDTKGAMWDPQPARKTPTEEMRTPDWAEPNLWDSLAIGFDVRNPKSEDWFNEDGNFYDRPQREVSLHWSGREVANRLCEAEIATGEPVAVHVVVEFVVGGAEVTVEVGGKKIYDHHFLPHVMPYECRVGLGAHGTGEAFLDDVEVSFGEAAAPMPAPINVQAIARWWVRRGKGNNLAKGEVELLPNSVAVDRIIMTVVYRGPMHRDYWDRNAAVYAFGDDGTRYEVARIITPFMLWDTEYRYDLDVTHFAPLLFGKRSMAVMVGSAVARGFLVDVHLTYYRRPSDMPVGPEVVSVHNLWSGKALFNKKGQIETFFEARKVKAPEGAKRALVRITVTGHGVMEFTKLGRTLTVNGKAFKNTLWREDSYLNPHRPQFGTWKFDRAGWSPGAIVEPWIVDVSDQVEPGGVLEIDYAPDAFEADKWADHWVEAQVVFLKS